MSQKVRRLEQMVGRQLLERGSQRVRATDAGETVLAHARRMLSLNDEMLDALSGADLGRLDSPHELAVAAKLGEFPEVIETAARELAPHMVAFYLKDLAAEFHSYYNAERMLVDDAGLKAARIALAGAVRQTIQNGMAILGVSCPQSM